MTERLSAAVHRQGISDHVVGHRRINFPLECFARVATDSIMPIGWCLAVGLAVNRVFRGVLCLRRVDSNEKRRIAFGDTVQDPVAQHRPRFPHARYSEEVVQRREQRLRVL